ncbi:hypothetical protein [uncultured Methanolobus sp.]|uniref:hypothetical protein n=1 Tax=uncultured Methanolobus sp. TaxID=218300 RepID=UPI0029C66D2F|nr:hypothetical protein [uncultured Methanolobus sp.]
MHKRNYIIADSGSFREYKSLLGSGGWKWVFIGTDPLLQDSIQKELSYDYNYPFAQELQEICHKNKQLFLDLLADYLSYQDVHITNSTNTAYKNPLTSDIFLNFCFYFFIKERIMEKKDKIIFLVEDSSLIRTCLLTLKNQDCEIRFKNKNFILPKSKLFISCHSRLLYKFVISIFLWAYNKLFYRDHYKQVEQKLQQVQIVFFTWVEDRSFQELTGLFVDPYVGKLKEYYSGMGFSSLFLTLPLLSIDNLKKSYSSGDLCPCINYLSPIDMLSAFLKTFFFKWKKIKGSFSFSTFELLFASEKKWDKQDMYLALLQYKACKRLFSLQNLDGKYVIYPFENQPWDKMMLLAIKESKVKCKTVGYQHTTIPHFMMNYFLGKDETDILPQPDIIVANGEHWRKVLKKSGFSSIIKNGGSLRYVSFQSSECHIDKLKSILEVKGKNILVLLSYSIFYSIDLISYLLRNNAEDMNFLIKPHPNYPERIIRKYFPKLPSNFTFVHGSMSECMEIVSFAIHTGTTAAVECMMSGINVIKYLPERIDLDPLLDTGFKQHVITNKDVLNISEIQKGSSIDSSLIAEPFVAITWKEILK